MKQEGLDGKVIPLSQGKLLGGSSAINGQAFVANSKAAVDAWAAFGSPGWDWKTMAPYYKKFHTLSRSSEAACKHLRLDYIDVSILLWTGTYLRIRLKAPTMSEPADDCAGKCERH